MHFGKKLKDLRKRRRLTQAELAEVLGLSLKTVRNYETGVCYPKQRDIYYALSDFFKVDVNYLLTDTDVSEEHCLKNLGLQDRAQQLIIEARNLFFSSELSSAYKKEIADAIHEIYYEARYVGETQAPKVG